MKKLGFLLLLVSLGAFTFGCEAQKPADDTGIGTDEAITDDTGTVEGTDDMSGEEAGLEDSSPDTGFDIAPEPDTTPVPDEGAGLDEPAAPVDDPAVDDEAAPEDNS